MARHKGPVAVGWPPHPNAVPPSPNPGAPPPPPPVWQVIIYPKLSPSDGVVAWLTDTSPQPSGGGGGHEAVVMPKRSPVSFWRGRQDLLTMTLPIMFDGWATDTGVRASRQNLIKMWRPEDATKAPPVVRILAAGDAVPWQGIDWTISTVEFGSMLAMDDMTTVRELHVVTLQEFVADERLGMTATKQGSSAQRHTSKKRQQSGSSSQHSKTYRVRSGDTLSGIAARNDVKGGWRALADAQHPPITDPRSLRVGQVLTLP